MKPILKQRPSAVEALKIAEAVAPYQPPAAVDIADRPTSLTIRLRSSTVRSIMAVAKERSQTMKQLLSVALDGAGVQVAPADLEDRTPRRKA